VFRLATSNNRLRCCDDLIAYVYDFFAGVVDLESTEEMEDSELDECWLVRLVLATTHARTLIWYTASRTPIHTLAPWLNANNRAYPAFMWLLSGSPPSSSQRSGRQMSASGPQTVFRRSAAAARIQIFWPALIGIEVIVSPDGVRTGNRSGIMSSSVATRSKWLTPGYSRRLRSKISSTG